MNCVDFCVTAMRSVTAVVGASRSLRSPARSLAALRLASLAPLRGLSTEATVAVAELPALPIEALPTRQLGTAKAEEEPDEEVRKLEAARKELDVKLQVEGSTQINDPQVPRAFPVFPSFWTAKV